MYHIFIPHAGPFDSNVDIYVAFGFDLDFLIDLLDGYDFEINYVTHYDFDGGIKSNVNC